MKLVHAYKSEEKQQHDQAVEMAAAQSLRRKLEESESFDYGWRVPIGEYKEMDAIESDPNPVLRGYFMPHHGVYREDAVTTKSTVVFNGSMNGSSISPAKSINDVVDPGHSLIPSWTGPLMHFRESKVAFQPSMWKNSVANKIVVSQATNKEWNVVWQHYPRTLSPGDVASRGSSIQLLKESWLADRGGLFI